MDKLNTDVAPGFVVLEGPDYSGKTTVAEHLEKRLREHLADSPVPVESGFDPGCTELAAKLRQIVKDPKVNIPAMAHFLLFQAARIDLQEHLVRPNADAGGVTLMQRWTDSTRVYQGMLQGIPTDTLDAVFRHSHCLPPQLIIILDVSDKEAERRYDLSDRTEQDYFEKKEFRQTVREGYRKLPTSCTNPNKEYKRLQCLDMYCSATIRVRVNADLPIAQVVDECWAVILRELKTTVLRDV
jgi:dTMP kinase